MYPVMYPQMYVWTGYIGGNRYPEINTYRKTLRGPRQTRPQDVIENGPADCLSWKDGEPSLREGPGVARRGESAAQGSSGSKKPRRRRGRLPPSKSSSCDTGSTSYRRCWLPTLCNFVAHRCELCLRLEPWPPPRGKQWLGGSFLPDLPPAASRDKR